MPKVRHRTARAVWATVSLLISLGVEPAQSAPLVAGLPPTEKNVELVGKLELNGHFGNVDAGQIADLSHKGNYAYVNSWRSPARNRCDRGGVFVVDISNPADPKEVGFIASPKGTFPGEGSQVVAINTAAFKGDLLTINNESCADPDSTPATLHGGVTLVDVTNPLAPVVLSEGVGDPAPSAAVPGVKSSPIHLVHSAFTWQSGTRAFTVMVDIQELEGLDILDVTDPRAPVLVNELDLRDGSAIGGTAVSGTAWASNVSPHDMIVKKIGGRDIMLVSYWDGGYVKLDVTDPESVQLIGDTNFGPVDPLFPAFTPPEGNAHQAEFSHDNRYIVAADEDFAPFRGRLTNAGGAGFNFVEPADATTNVVSLPGGEIVSESVKFVGRACWSTGTPDTIQPAPAPVDTNPNTRRVAVIERGLCGFDEKVQGAEDAGYEAFVIFDIAGVDPVPTNYVLDDPGFPGRGVLPGGFITRADALAGLFGGSAPAVGDSGSALAIANKFDGWGYAHLYDAASLAELDAWAVTEARDERFALNRAFGELTIHEVATDPVASLAYVSYYHAGFRVLSFGNSKLTEVGRFIDERGNNLWGVDVASDAQGGRLILASDRDYGLYVFRYTGPGAVTAPVPAPASPAPSQAPAPSAKPASPTEPDSRFKFGPSVRLKFRNGRATLRIYVRGAGKVNAALRERVGTRLRSLSHASATTPDARWLALTFRLSARSQRELRRTLRRRPSHLTRAIATVDFTPAGGAKRVRKRTLSIGMSP